MDEEIIINSLLCFMNSADDDYSQGKLCEIIYSFYSHETIKSAKELVFGLNKKDLTWRRGTDKKMSDLNDLYEGFFELKSKNRRLKFLSDSYKCMPPIGLEYLAPILINLSEEMSKINETLPSFLEIKSTVTNTADTVRELKKDICNLKQGHLNTPNSQIKRGSIQLSPCIEQKLKSLRQNGVTDHVSKPNCSISLNNRINNNELIMPPDTNSDNNVTFNNIHVNNENTSSVSDAPPINADSSFSDLNKNSLQSKESIERNLEVEDPITDSSQHKNEWITINRNKHKNKNKQQKSSDFIMGSKFSPNNKFKAASRTIDIFIGRVDISVDSEAIKEYVKNNFSIDILEITKLDIKAENYNAFKVTVNFSDRNALFNGNNWPCGIIINKYYNRRKN